MNNANFLAQDFILTEGAVIERLKHEYNLPLDEVLGNSCLCFSHSDRQKLERIYASYILIAQKSKLPMILYTPTWRANAYRCKKKGYDTHHVNRENVLFLRDVITKNATDSQQIKVAGMIGPQGDAYRAGEALSDAEAFNFHQMQIQALAQNGVDFIIATTMPALSEILGISRYCAQHDIPYLISFMMNKSGCLLDGTPLTKAISTIDHALETPPLGYMANCIHPDNLYFGLTQAHIDREILVQRFLGVQGNSSPKSPEELDNSPTLDVCSPETMAVSMMKLRNEFGIRIFGGCCGTNDQHIAMIAKLSIAHN